MEPPNIEHVVGEHFVHCSEVVPSSEVEMYTRQGVNSVSIVVVIVMGEEKSVIGARGMHAL